MKPDTSTDSRYIIQEALCTAVRHLAELDNSIPYGNYPVVPEVVTWIVENENPELARVLTTAQLWDRFSGLLVEYGQLRKFAEQFVTDEDYYDPYGWNPPPMRVEFHHLKHAIDLHDAPVSQLFVELFHTASEQIVEALGNVDAVYWDGTIPPSPLRQPAPTPVFDHYETEWTSRLSGYRPSSGRDNLAVALSWFIDQTSFLDDGRHDNFWETVDVTTVLDWFRRDLPSIATSLTTENRMDALRTAAQRYVDAQRQIEPDWRHLGWYLRALLVRYADMQTALKIIGTVTSAFATSDSPSPPVVDVYTMFCRRLGDAAPGEDAPSCETALSSEVIELIRRDEESDRTCYLVNRSSLPETLRSHTGEQFCLAVRVPEERLPFSDKLKKDRGLDYFFSTYDKKVYREHLTLRHGFWTDRDVLHPLLRHFRFELPITYIFDKIVLLVVYRYNCFADVPAALTRLPRKYVPTVELSEGEWTYGAADHTERLPDGRQLKPLMLGCVRDLSDAEVSTS
ncbi:hypothetical protein [Paraburkholderia caribensis]|uniref:hypothetical protein n=1 Tax=Paraburkholderia caribensis TaxID=75105 RepID=UPI00078DBCF3|nr:hypothetical protein [Paraburkholderia caribensis]AMV47839.1 hypothetical protein ATN79_45055 [Paraburkholderia caribensis]